MSKTIKQLADLLEVSKTAVRNYMTEEFRTKYTVKDCKGTLLVSEDGCKLLATNMGRIDKLPQQTANKFAETEESGENITIPRSVLTLLQAQLEEKDRQIADLTATVRSQAESLRAEQALHAGTLQKQLSLEDKGRKWRFFGRKKGE